MRLGIVIPVYNRPNELRECLKYLATANVPRGTRIVIVDDASTWTDIPTIIAQFAMPGVEITRLRHITNGRVSKALQTGFGHVFKSDCTHGMVLDSDVIVRPDFIQVLQRLQARYQGYIITGFNSLNTTLQGTPRHPIVGEGAGCYFKSSVGGINMLFSKEVYTHVILPQLNKVIASQGNWDAMACKQMMKYDKPIVVSVPSVVQHMATASAMGHMEEPDVACDFFMLDLPKVTLLGVDCIHLDKLEAAAKACTKYIRFGAVRLLTSQGTGTGTGLKDSIYRCRHISSKADYSRFMIKEVADYFDTDYCLVIQHDGWVVNYVAWAKEFLSYDYVGATWWFKDGMNVGNGGFSIRSKRLQRLLQKDDTIANVHPEDERICRTYRKYLESKGMKFAPAEVADRFSIESAYSPDKKYSGQFGFHGKGIIFNK